MAGPRTTIVLGGDVMLNGISTKAQPLHGIAQFMRRADVTIVNLEIPLTNATESTPNKSSDDLKKRNQYILKADPNHVNSLAVCGIDLVSLGNNHAMDYRAAGLTQMQGLLTKRGIGYAGAGANRAGALAPVYFTTAGGKRIGLISALAFVGAGAQWHTTPATETAAGVGTFAFNGVLNATAKQFLSDSFAAAKANCDILIVGLHWGIEKQGVPNAYQVSLGRACIDAGADIVWGNHPHVLQGAELYKGKPILYSMGNMISSRPGDTGLVRLTYGDGGMKLAEFVPLVISASQTKRAKAPRFKQIWASYKGLCKAIQTRYPSKDSKSLF